MKNMKTSLSNPTVRIASRKFHPLTLLAVAGIIFTGLMATSASAAPLVWRSNDFEGGSTWFGGNSGITTDQALSPTHSLELPGNNTTHEYQPFAEMPTLNLGETFGSFVFTIYVNDLNNSTQSYERAIKFSKPDNSSESSYYTKAYAAVGSGWGQLNFDFTTAANSNYAAGRTKISRAYFKAYNSGTYVPYYVDDASFTYTIIPEPTSLGLLGLGGLFMLTRRRRSGRSQGA